MRDKTFQPLIIGKNGVGLGIKEIDVPETDQSHQNGQVPGQWRGSEMLVHFMSSCQQLIEFIHSYAQCNGKSDGRPQRITSADPVPESEHMLRVDAKAADLGLICREGHKMLCDIPLLLRGSQKPTPCRMGIE